MKKLFLIITLQLLFSSVVYGGELQKQYEKGKSLKYKDFENYQTSYIVKQDLKNYHCCRKSFYGEVIYLINKADESSYQFLLKIKRNYNNCSKNLKCWEYIDVDDYHYNWLDSSTKNVIWFNNMVFNSFQKDLNPQYKVQNSLNKIDLEILTKIRDFDKYEPIPKSLQDEYIIKIPENFIENFRFDMSKGLKHVLQDKITYNNKTLEQMLLDFNKKADFIYQEFLKNPTNSEQNELYIEQLKEMNGTISLYPDTIIEELQPYIKKYNLRLEPGAECDIFLYKYYIEKYHIKYSNDLKKLLKCKEYVCTKIDTYISKLQASI